MAKIKNQLKRCSLATIKFYRFFISPALGINCRFTPSCSKYTFIAIRRFGIIVGVYLGLKRLLKCHPFHPGGRDPVPREYKFYR